MSGLPLFCLADTLSLSSDFENKFVCGEIMSIEDLREHGSEAAVKAAGRLRQQGKPYESEYHMFFYLVLLISMPSISGRWRYSLLESRSIVFAWAVRYHKHVSIRAAFALV